MRSTRLPKKGLSIDEALLIERAVKHWFWISFSFFIINFWKKRSLTYFDVIILKQRAWWQNAYIEIWVAFLECHVAMRLRGKCQFLRWFVLITKIRRSNERKRNWICCWCSRIEIDRFDAKHGATAPAAGYYSIYPSYPATIATSFFLDLSFGVWWSEILWTEELRF